ncbi:atrial natriuretic peptide receptor 3 isoform X4 [Frankliniella occidentalis]|uniref:Atrial natriuretic peptide receptor 3 isoform X4 n=1 Tax=Frankliniella occidentalis TaxID=133901 RepID=A0A9C6WZK8_FRAOC|nr:atrial natriuretic peptide receptor 3 isoform X4 [Frankliniella occidentalis]
MVKFWNTPLLTVGALTHDFSQKKTSCDDEYHMLTRVGSLGFRDVALFLVSVMDHYSWRRVMLVYDKDGYRRVSGEHTCKLMMEALVKRLKQHNLQFRAFDTEKAANQGVKEHLRREVGNDFSGFTRPVGAPVLPRRAERWGWSAPRRRCEPGHAHELPPRPAMSVMPSARLAWRHGSGPGAAGAQGLARCSGPAAARTAS